MWVILDIINKCKGCCSKTNINTINNMNMNPLTILGFHAYLCGRWALLKCLRGEGEHLLLFTILLLLVCCYFLALMLHTCPVFVKHLNVVITSLFSKTITVSRFKWWFLRVQWHWFGLQLYIHRYMVEIGSKQEVLACWEGHTNIKLLLPQRFKLRLSKEVCNVKCFYMD